MPIVSSITPSDQTQCHNEWRVMKTEQQKNNKKHAVHNVFAK